MIKKVHAQLFPCLEMDESMPLSFQILKNKEPNLKFDRDMSCRDIYLKVTRIIINALKNQTPWKTGTIVPKNLKE